MVVVCSLAVLLLQYRSSLCFHPENILSLSCFYRESLLLRQSLLVGRMQVGFGLHSLSEWIRSWSVWHFYFPQSKKNHLICLYCPVGWGCRIHLLHLSRGIRPHQWVSLIWHYTIWWWVSSNVGALGNTEHHFIAIAPRSTLAWRDRAW